MEPKPNRNDSYTTVLSFLKESRKNGKISTKDWEHFRSRLSSLSLDSSFAQALDIWTMDNLEFHKPETIRTRVLHELEEQIFTPEVYSEYLEALRFGMISPVQGEQILDDLIDTELFKIQPERMQNSISKIWKKNIHNYARVKPN